MNDYEHTRMRGFAVIFIHAGHQYFVILREYGTTQVNVEWHCCAGCRLPLCSVNMEVTLELHSLHQRLV